MGVALAQEAQRLGARVTLVLGPVDAAVTEKLRASTLRTIPVVSAQEMDAAVRKHLPGTQIFIGAAAVADYRPAFMSRQKIKKKKGSLTLRMVRNPDIIARVAQRHLGRPPVVIGFALETRDLLRHAMQKLQAKGLDWIVANREANIGRRQGRATLLSRWGEKITLSTMLKERLAQRIWQALLLRVEL